MTTIFTRSALKYHGFGLPPNIACIINGQVVTYDDIRRGRREREARILNNRRDCTEWRAAKLWVAYFDQNLMGGWHAFLENRNHRSWINRDLRHVQPRLMELFPSGLLRDDWQGWMVEFAKRHETRRQCRQPVGVVYLWWDRSWGIELRPPVGACIAGVQTQ